MTKREGIRPDARKRERAPSLEFQRLPELRPGPPAGYREGYMRGFALGLVAMLALALLFQGLS